MISKRLIILIILFGILIQAVSAGFYCPPTSTYSGNTFYTDSARIENDNLYCTLYSSNDNGHTKIVHVTGEGTGVWYDTEHSSRDYNFNNYPSVDALCRVLVPLDSHDDIGSMSWSITTITNIVYSGDLDASTVSECKDRIAYSTSYPIPVSCDENSIIGDADGSGVLGYRDARFIESMAAGELSSPANVCCVDVNNDGSITSEDGQLVVNKVDNSGSFGNAGMMCSEVSPVPSDADEDETMCITDQASGGANSLWDSNADATFDNPYTGLSHAGSCCGDDADDDPDMGSKACVGEKDDAGEQIAIGCEKGNLAEDPSKRSWLNNVALGFGCCGDDNLDQIGVTDCLTLSSNNICIPFGGTVEVPTSSGETTSGETTTGCSLLELLNHQCPNGNTPPPEPEPQPMPTGTPPFKVVDAIWSWVPSWIAEGLVFDVGCAGYPILSDGSQWVACNERSFGAEPEPVSECLFSISSDSNAHVAICDSSYQKRLYCTPSSGTLACDVKTSCSAGETEILQMKATTNSHAALAGQDYDYKVCCSLDGAAPTISASSGNFIVSLSDTRNAHASTTGSYSPILYKPSPTTTGYLNNIHFTSDITCEYKTGTATPFEFGGPIFNVSGISNPYSLDHDYFCYNDATPKIAECCGNSTSYCNITDEGAITSGLGGIPKITGEIINITNNARCTQDSIIGDVNGDGTITPGDSLLIANIVLGIEAMPLNKCCVDADNDDDVDQDDVQMVLNYYSILTPTGNTGMLCSDISSTEIMPEHPLTIQYCADDYRWTTDLDTKDEYSCEQAKNTSGQIAGFKWTGNYCCSENDDIEEYYNDEGGGGCWNKEPVLNSNFVSLNNRELEEVYLYNGTFHGCAIDTDSAVANTPNGDTTRTENKPYEGSYNYLENPDFESEMSGWALYEQAHSDIAQSTTAKSGTYSVLLHQDSGQPYPGTCTENLCTAQIGCSYNGMDGGCTFQPEPYHDAPTQYDPGDTFVEPYGNHVVWAALVIGNMANDPISDKFNMEVGKNYSLTFWYKGNLAANANIYGCYYAGFCQQYLGWPVLTMPSISAGNYDVWQKYSTSFVYTTEMATGCSGPDNSGADYEGDSCFRELAINLDYADTTSGGSDFYVDDIRIANNDFLLDYKDYPNSQGHLNSDGTEQLITEHAYCDKIGLVSNGVKQYYCSYLEVWKETGGINLTHLSYINWTDTLAQQAECCKADECWNSLTCVPNQKNTQEAPTEGYRCVDGRWEDAATKYTWDRLYEGYCSSKTQCLVDTSGNAANNNDPSKFAAADRGSSSNNQNPVCIETGQFIQDNYCENGNWTTRTKLIGLQLLNLAGADDYTLFCDNYSNVLAYCDYRIGGEILGEKICGSYLGKKPEGTYNPDPMFGIGTEFECVDGKGNHIPCINNICLLSYDDKLVLGTSLNQPINANTYSFLLTLGTGTDKADCNAKIDDANNQFDQCISQTGQTFYHDQIKAVIYTKDGGISLAAVNWWDSFINFLKNPITGIIDLLQGITITHGTLDYTFAENITGDFDRFYMAKKGSRNVFGIVEEKYMQPGGLYKKLLFIKYSNFVADLCDAIDVLDTQLGGNRLYCDKSAAYDYYVVNKNQEPDFTQILNDFAAKIRWQPGAPPPPNNQPIANAGPDQNVGVNILVTLDGSGSSDPDGSSITYSWTQTAGPENVALSNPTAVNPSFTPTKTGTYSFQLIVNDGSADSSADTVDIIVSYTTPTLYLEPSTLTVSAGTQFTVSVKVAAVSDLYSSPFYLNYDPAVVNVVSAAEGSFLNQDGGSTTFLKDIDNTNGKIIIGLARLGESSGVSGSGTLVTATFSTIAAGSSNLQFSNVDFADSNQAQISVTAQDGSVAVS